MQLTSLIPAWQAIGPAQGPLLPPESFWTQYQGLVGAAIGTFGAFLVALVAFALSKWGERQDAAFTAYFELEMYKTAVRAFLDEVEEPPMPRGPEDAEEPGVPEYVRAVERLRSARPSVSASLEQAMTKLYAPDPLLAIHLQTFRASAVAADRVFEKLDDAEDRKLAGGDVGYDKPGLYELIRSAGGLARSAANLAEEATKVLGETYVEKWAWFRRGKRWLRRRALPGEYLRAMKIELPGPSDPSEPGE